MSAWNGRRLDALEAENPVRSKVTVLEAPVGREDEVVRAYYRNTHQEQWAELVVVVIKFCREH